MSEYVLLTDSSADFGQKMVEELGIEVLPLSFSMDGKTYQDWADNRDIDPKDFYKTLRGGSMSTTSQVNTETFVEAFRPSLEAGKDVLYLGFSSGLSGTVNSGFIAAKELNEEFTDNRVVVVDTLAASLGQGLLVWYAAKMKQDGKSLDEVAQWVEDNKLNLAHWFTVDDLNFLKRGGRLSAASALLGTMLSIKPVLHVDDEGHLIAMDKVRGRKQSLTALVDKMEASVKDVEGQTVFISHGDCLEDAQTVADDIKKRFGITDFYINFVGPVIGSHSGPGTVALFFIANAR